MQEKTFAEGQSYAPATSKFLWWLATVDGHLLSQSRLDGAKHAIVGTTVLCTWLFATAAWSYFFYTAVHQVFIAILLGLGMGGIILSIDRALIQGLYLQGKKRWTTLFFRMLIAGCIGSFMAQPVLQYLFKKEISLQISIDNEAKKKIKEQAIDSVYAASMQHWQQMRQNAQQQIDLAYQEVATARNNFIAETDGTGGSKKRGLEAIARTKKEAYEKLDAQYQQKNQLLQPILRQADSAVFNIQQAKAMELQQFNTLLNDGFLTRSEALQHLLKEHPSLRIRYWLLVTILLFIELMPLIAKLLLPSGSYEQLVANTLRLEQQLIDTYFQQQLLQQQAYNQQVFTQNTNATKAFFETAATATEEQTTELFQKDQSLQTIWQALQAKAHMQQQIH